LECEWPSWNIIRKELDFDISKYPKISLPVKKENPKKSSFLKVRHRQNWLPCSPYSSAFMSPCVSVGVLQVAAWWR
jgi:hypothetical protein